MNTVLNEKRLAPRSIQENRDYFMQAIKLVGPAKAVVVASLTPLSESGLFDLDFNDLAGDVIGHLLAFHSELVVEHPGPTPLAAFAMGRAVVRLFDGEHERTEQRACAIGLAEILKDAAGNNWPHGDQQLLVAATNELVEWDQRPGHLLQPSP